MNISEQNKPMQTRCMTEMSHHLKSPIYEIQNYSRMIIDGSTDPSLREYAEKIESISKHLVKILDNNVAHMAVDPNPLEEAEDSANEIPHVLVVDDDELVLGMASYVLEKMYRVTAVTSGAEALEALKSNKYSLILMDVIMPGMDGFETLRRIRNVAEWSMIPVIFLTGDESRDTELRCFRSGASDFVRKPFLSQVLLERVRRIIDLDHLQNFLSREVVVQTKRAGHLSKEIMLALSKAVDAKDHYTNGHSQRVAHYSVEIARRMGKSRSELEDIYSMGLLHDVGKIGVSEAIINKKTRLTDEEYAEIKTHTTMGYDILKVITELPGLATGARWHHERYDGRGYPDGLSGTDIPEEARIICVADCYDAMTSNRSYSKVRAQSEVRAEILRCKGTQFDPEIADIMIAMIDDDTEYRMSERPHSDSDNEAVLQNAAGSETKADRKDLTNIQVEHTEQKMTAQGGVLPTIDALDRKAALQNIPNDEILLKSLSDYCRLMPEKQKRLEEAFAQIEQPEALDTYRINVHAMKSSSAMLGLLSLGSMARQLEEFAKNKDIPSIRKYHDAFMKEWEQTHAQLQTFFGQIEVPGSSEQLPNVSKQSEQDDGKKTVMVVDDDAGMLRTIKNILEKEYHVVIVPSGTKAVPLIRKKNPDVILLDYEMPVCNGVQTLELIRVEDDMKHIPVIFLTGTNDKEHITKIQSLKPAGYLMKPLNMGKLKEAIGEVI